MIYILYFNNITSHTVFVKQGNLSSTDFDEIISLIRQTKNFLEKKCEKEEQEIENIKFNNPDLFTQWKCSTDGEYNGRGVWENWHTFHGKHNGHNWTIYVPDSHITLTNVLFDDGWGTNSEVGKFFVVEGVTKPTTLHYWNVDKQKYEIISEKKAQRLKSQDKDQYIKYETYVELNDKISIDHYSQKTLTELSNETNGKFKNTTSLFSDENNDRKLAIGVSIVSVILLMGILTIWRLKRNKKKN